MRRGYFDPPFCLVFSITEDRTIPLVSRYHYLTNRGKQGIITDCSKEYTQEYGTR